MKQLQLQVQDRKRLSDVAPAGGDYTKMAEVADRDLLLLAATPDHFTFEGVTRPGYKIVVKELHSDEEYTVITTAIVVCKQLDKALQAEGPFEEFVVQFQKSGRCWIMV